MLITFRVLNTKLILQNIECSVRFIRRNVFAVMFVLSVMVILASTYRRELLRLKYKLLEHLIVNLMAIICD